jgi:hypothetical protein
MRALCGLLALCAIALGSARGDDRVVEEVELVPEAHAAWGIRNVAAAVSSLFGAWSYWYGEQSVLVDTAPQDAQIELFYVRANFQRGFLRATSPVRVRLPSRIRATTRDALIVRVSAPGFRTREETRRVVDLPEKIVTTLEPLPNKLVFLGHTHIADRTTLAVRTTEKPEFRVMKSRTFPGFTLILVETGLGLERVPALSGGLVLGVDVAQVGEDLLLHVRTQDPETEVRSRMAFDSLRQEHVFALDMGRPGARPASASAIAAEVSRAALAPGDPCDGRFERSLRAALESVRSGASPSGGLADLYRREMMLFLGRTDHGTVHTLSGEQLRTGSAIELEAALQSSFSVEGYLALAGAYARTQEDPSTVLRSLVAPDLDPAVFAPLHEAAEQAWRGCRERERPAAPSS